MTAPRQRPRTPLFEVRLESPTPKYQQIVEGVIGAIRAGRARRGDPLPSASQLCAGFQLARETVLKAYAALKGMGIVRAVPRKGYFVATETVAHVRKVLLFFDELSPYKQELYESFRKHVGPSVITDIGFHHCDIRAFRTLLDRAEYYTLCVVMPFEDKAVPGILGQLDRSKLLLLDRAEGIGPEDAFVGQDHDRGLQAALESGAELFAKYRKLHLVWPEPGDVAIHSSQAPTVIARAFRRFCTRHGKPCAVVRAVGDVKRGEAWFVIDDADLVAVVAQAGAKGLQLGRDLGVLAYNETAMRQIVAGGITVVSTDFREMGRLAAEHVLNPLPRRVIVPTRLIRRQSL